MNSIILRRVPAAEPSIVPQSEQERTRLLLEIKNSGDFYELAYASAEYSGYVRGLFFGGHISEPQLVLFQHHLRSVARSADHRLSGGPSCAL